MHQQASGRFEAASRREPDPRSMTRAHGLSLWLGEHHPALRSNATPLGGPTDFQGGRGLGAFLSLGTLQREQGALGIGASHDPAASSQFDRTLDDTASTSADAL